MLKAPVNNSGKVGCGVSRRNKHYGKCAAQPKRRRRGKPGVGGTAREEWRKTEMPAA